MAAPPAASPCAFRWRERSARSLRRERRHPCRVFHARRRAARPRARPRRLHEPRSALGHSRIPQLLRATGLVLAPDLLRQARHGPVRPSPCRDARGTHGRHPRDHGRGRIPQRRPEGRLRGRAAPDTGTRALRCRGEGGDDRGLAVGRGDQAGVRELHGRRNRREVVGPGRDAGRHRSEPERRRAAAQTARPAAGAGGEPARCNCVHAHGLRDRRAPRRSGGQHAGADCAPSR